MTEIRLIRHGETDWNAAHKIQGRTDIPLNETGLEQAEMTAEKICGENWDIVYSSPLKRARKTAEIIAEASGISSIHTEEDLLECEFGEAEGMTLTKRREIFPDRDNIPGAEKLDEIKERADRIIREIASRHQGKKILIVSHACFIMEALSIFSGGEIDGRKTRLINLSMNSLKLEDGRWSVPWYNRSALDKQKDSAFSVSL